MSRGWLIVAAIWAASAAPLRAGEEKVLSVAKDGLAIEGKITKDDPKVKVTEPKLNVSVDVPAKVHLVKFSAGVKYRIELSSKDCDTLLTILDTAGKQLAFDDDGGGETNSRLDFVPTKDGAYKVVAAALDPPGAFKLTITAGTAKVDVKVDPKGEPKKVDPKAPAGEAVPVPKDGLKIDGSVAQSDPKVGIVLGERVDQLPGKIHLVKLTAGKKYQFDVIKSAGSGLDVPVLIVQDKAGKQFEWAPPVGGVRVQLLAPTSDVYRVAVAAAKGEGAYAVAIKEIALLKEETNVNELGADGLTLKGKLGKETRVICYKVKLEADKTYTIDMTSPNQKALDPYLKVYDAAGKLLMENDDIAMDDLNARINFRVPAAGVFRIDASSFGNLGLGDFTLDIKLKK